MHWAVESRGCDARHRTLYFATRNAVVFLYLIVLMAQEDAQERTDGSEQGGPARSDVACTNCCCSMHVLFVHSRSCDTASQSCVRANNSQKSVCDEKTLDSWWMTKLKQTCF